MNIYHPPKTLGSLYNLSEELHFLSSTHIVQKAQETETPRSSCNAACHVKAGTFSIHSAGKDRRHLQRYKLGLHSTVSRVVQAW